MKKPITWENRNEAFKEWKRKGGYQISMEVGKAFCLYLRSECIANHPFHTHLGSWVRPDGSRFLLSHVRIKDDGEDGDWMILVEAGWWATDYGFRVVEAPEDAWFGFGTTPIRFEFD